MHTPNNTKFPFVNSNLNVICFVFSSSSSAVKMNVDQWQVEMNLMLEIFEQQSELSLRKINQRFQELNRKFTDEFREYFVKMSMQRYVNAQLWFYCFNYLFSLCCTICTQTNSFLWFDFKSLRLDISYTKVELEQWNNIQGSEIASNSEGDRQSLISVNTSPMAVRLRTYLIEFNSSK